MTPLVQAVVVVCAVALTLVLVVTLVALRRLAVRAAAVLEVVERDLRPLTEDVRQLSRQATKSLERANVVIERAEEVSAKVASVLGVVATAGRVGQIASLALGLKRGLGVFASRLASTSGKRGRHYGS
jgi:uncharacterized protein YoxC